MKPGELHREAENAGWKVKRVNGGHKHYTHPSLPGLLAIPTHGNNVDYRLSKQILLNIKKGCKR